jgi:hypothetical protein
VQYMFFFEEDKPQINDENADEKQKRAAFDRR